MLFRWLGRAKGTLRRVRASRGPARRLTSTPGCADALLLQLLLWLLLRLRRLLLLLLWLLLLLTRLLLLLLGDK